jgi:hypothetical protein
MSDDVIDLMERVLREEDVARAFREASDARDQWIAEQLLRRWPLLAEVPAYTQRLLSAVQRLLASTTRIEAEQAAAAVASEADSLRLLRPMYVKVVAGLTVLAPVELRIPITKTEVTPS